MFMCICIYIYIYMYICIRILIHNKGSRERGISHEDYQGDDADHARTRNTERRRHKNTM